MGAGSGAVDGRGGGGRFPIQIEPELVALVERQEELVTTLGVASGNSRTVHYVNSAVWKQVERSTTLIVLSGSR